MHSKAKQTKMSEFGTEKGLLQDPYKETGDWCPPNPEPPEGFQQSVFKGKGSCKFLGVAIPCSCSYTSRYGHHIPVNLQ